MSYGNHLCRMKLRLLLFTTLCINASLLAKVPTKPSGKKVSRTPSKANASPSATPKPTQSNVHYGTHERHLLDFWKAPSSSPTPLVLIIHGGGWGSGSKAEGARFADISTLLKAGISVVSINYRLIRQNPSVDTSPPVKAPLHDAARALQFVRSKAKEWNIDKARIGAAGGSAGACSSIWLAFHADLADPRSSDPIARESTRLTCAAVVSPQTTLDPEQMKKWIPNSYYGGHAFGFSNFEAFLAGRRSILPLIAKYSPYALVSADDPPIHMTFSSAPAVGETQSDPTHSANFGIKLAERCAKKGVQADVSYPGAPNIRHASPTAFLIAKLKPSTNG